MFKKSLRRLRRHLAGCVVTSLLLIVLARNINRGQDHQHYGAGEAGRRVEAVEYVQDDMEDADTGHVTTSIRRLSLQSGAPHTDPHPGAGDAREWSPYISVDSFTGNHSNNEAVKYTILHWMNVWTNCADYFSASVKQRFVYPYYHGNCSHDNMTTPDITLATQMDQTAAYWEKLEQTAHNWNGPVSVALYATLNDPSQMEDLKSLLETYFRNYNLYQYPVCVHLLTEKPHKRFLYPINSLRNVAVKFTHTKYVLYTEADFVPMPGLAQQVLKTAATMSTKKLALVIPAFRSPAPLPSFPQNKTHLLQQWRQNLTVPWCEGREWKAGHLPTMYHRIEDTQQPYQVEYAVHYEPYYAVEREGCPYYPEEVMYGAQDKIVHAALMNQSGYHFLVMPDTFIVHTPHAKSSNTGVVQTQTKCAHTAVQNLLRKIRQLPQKSLTTYMKTNIPRQQRRALQSQIKVRLREPSHQDLVLPAEMSNTSVHTQTVSRTYKQQKRLVAQRERSERWRAVVARQPHVQEAEREKREQAGDRHVWWALG